LSNWTSEIVGFVLCREEQEGSWRSYREDC
jgi:hypothetical protein